LSKREVLQDDVRRWLRATANYVVSRLPEVRYDVEIQEEGPLKVLALSFPRDQEFSPAMVRGVLAGGLNWLRQITNLPSIDLKVREERDALVARYLVDVRDEALNGATRLKALDGLRSILDSSGVFAWGRQPYRQLTNQLLKAKREYQGKRLGLQVETVLSSPHYRALDRQVVEKILKLVYPEGYKAA